MFEDVVVDVPLAVAVGAGAGEVLQPQVAVAVDFGVGQPGLEVRRSRQTSPDRSSADRKPTSLQRVDDGQVVGAASRAWS